ncbi:MAG TPA: ATP-binding protein, partial [Roseiflexaceae bacterium]|nr:ATP-binding protein [Roseiflexaceae bacterium]
PYSGPVGLVALVCVMAAYYSSNTILVSAVLAFKTGTSFWKVVSAAYARVHWVHFLTLPLGALLAILWHVDRWLMVIGFVLLLMAHRAFRALAASQSSRSRARALALQLEQLQSITTATVSSLQPTSVASTLSRRLAELLQARASWVVLFGPPVRQTALHGASPAWLEASTEYLATLQPHEIAQINPADLMPGAETPIQGTLLSIPMAVEQRILGVICLEFEGDAQLDDATQRVLTAFATQAALVMEHAEIFSALQRQQDELVRSSKLAALGTFSAGIAHEFNNVLAGILGHAQLGRFSDDAAEMAESFRVIEEACVRARKITSGLLTFARRRAPQRRLSRVQEAIETAQLLIERDLLKHNIELECRIEAVEPTVCDQDQLAQVVLNLLTNARDAISETDRPGRIVVSLGMEDGWIALRVADNGCGIDEELQYQLFQPFVTTKIGHSASGSGTGLGLAICYGIIESHKGTIDVTSSRGVGTTVTIRLPVVDGEQPEASPGLASQVSTRLRILVVDDEPQVLRSVTMLL